MQDGFENPYVFDFVIWLTLLLSCILVNGLVGSLLRVYDIGSQVHRLMECLHSYINVIVVFSM
jgi:hypothetical protein